MTLLALTASLQPHRRMELLAPTTVRQQAPARQVPHLQLAVTLSLLSTSPPPSAVRPLRSLPLPQGRLLRPLRSLSLPQGRLPCALRRRV